MILGVPIYADNIRPYSIRIRKTKYGNPYLKIQMKKSTDTVFNLNYPYPNTKYIIYYLIYIIQNEYYPPL
jgi:hypothetical protein